MPSVLQKGLARYLTPKQLDVLASVRVGIAGCGGLGSNLAFLLARCGIRRFLLLDMDTVEPSNLNRQQFWPEDVGRPKSEALADRLLALDPDLALDVRVLELAPENLPELLPLADIWAEALDEARAKRMLVEAALAAGKPVIAASGLAGWGGPAMRVRNLGLLTVVGDFERGIDTYPPLAPRVMQACSMMADCIVSRILGPCVPKAAQDK